MIKSLSKSTWIMFLFDLIILSTSTTLWCDYFNLSLKFTTLSVCLITITGLISLFLKGNYKIREYNITFWNAYRLFEGVIFAHIPALLLYFYIPANTLLRFIGFNILTVFACIYLYRLGFHYYLFNFKKVKKVLIIGANERAKDIAEVIKNKQALQMEVVGIVKSAEVEKRLSESLAKSMHFNLTSRDQERINKRIEEEQNFAYNEVPVFSDGKEIVDILNKTNSDIVIFTYKSNLLPTIPKDIKIYLMTDFYEMATGKYYVDDDNMEDYAYDIHKKYENSLYKTFKRRFDIITALIILVVTFPITGYIALRVWLTDKHSPFFTQTRVGKKGKTFECHKLRTMYINDYVPQDSEDVKYAESVKTDDRIIPFCRFVRKARFDEIPQMINILAGEMSIVGPRAEWVDEAKVFEESVPYYNLRQVINAGWTGWSHINMNPVFSVDEEKERLAYDLYYIKHRNIFWDFAILVKAVFLACGGRHK